MKSKISILAFLAIAFGASVAVSAAPSTVDTLNSQYATAMGGAAGSRITAGEMPGSVAGGCGMPMCSPTALPTMSLPLSDSEQPGALCGGYVAGAGAGGNGLVPCKGHNPRYGCPAGYARLGGDFQSPGDRYWYTCLKL